MAFKFENLIVWQRALDLSALVHEITLKFPKEELYILTSQMKRAADSVALNIAEGEIINQLCEELLAKISALRKKL